MNPVFKILVRTLLWPLYRDMYHVVREAYLCSCIKYWNSQYLIKSHTWTCCDRRFIWNVCISDVIMFFQPLLFACSSRPTWTRLTWPKVNYHDRAASFTLQNIYYYGGHLGGGALCRNDPQKYAKTTHDRNDSYPKQSGAATTQNLRKYRIYKPTPDNNPPW